MSAGQSNGHPALEQFVAEMNALLVRDAEEYYRAMMHEDSKSWNIRSVSLLECPSFAHELYDVVTTISQEPWSKSCATSLRLPRVAPLRVMPKLWCGHIIHMLVMQGRLRWVRKEVNTYTFSA